MTDARNGGAKNGGTIMVEAKNCVTIPAEVFERLRKENFYLRLCKRKHVKDVFNEKTLEKLKKEYNIENMYVDFSILTFGIGSEEAPSEND
jgi:hypothetical protein